MDIANDPDHLGDLVESLTTAMYKELKPLLKERIILDLKIKQLNHRSHFGEDFKEQIGAMEAMQEDIERQILEFLHSPDPQ